MSEKGPRADHPHTNPGDGRTECGRCGKYVWPVIHSCKGVRVVDAPPMFVVVRFCADGDSRHRSEVEYVRPTDTLAHAQEQLEHLRETATAGGRRCCRYEVFELRHTEPTAPNPDCRHEWHGADGGKCPGCGWDSHLIRSNPATVDNAGRSRVKRSDLSTRYVLFVVDHVGVNAWDVLSAAVPPKVALAAIHREVDAGNLDYGVWLGRPFLTPQGRAKLAELSRPSGPPVDPLNWETR